MRFDFYYKNDPVFSCFSTNSMLILSSKSISRILQSQSCCLDFLIQNSPPVTKKPLENASLDQTL